MNKFRVFIAMFIVGFICIALDVHIDTSFTYPNEYINSNDVIGEYQYNNIRSNYNGHCTYKMIETTVEENGKTTVIQQATHIIDEVFFDNLQIDIFNDFLGYLLILIACIGFGKSHGRFKGAAVFATMGFILHGVIVALPFMTNGLTLCNMALAVGISYMFCFIVCGFLVSSGLAMMCPGVVCRDERKWGQLLSFSTIVVHTLVTAIYWVATDHAMLRGVGHFFVGVEVLLIISFALVLKRCDYILKDNFKA